jgi:hypothetical protein
VNEGVKTEVTRARMNAAKALMGEVLEARTVASGGIALDVIHELKDFFEGYGVAVEYLEPVQEDPVSSTDGQASKLDKQRTGEAPLEIEEQLTVGPEPDESRVSGHRVKGPWRATRADAERDGVVLRTGDAQPERNPDDWAAAMAYAESAEAEGLQDYRRGAIVALADAFAERRSEAARPPALLEAAEYAERRGRAAAADKLPPAAIAYGIMADYLRNAAFDVLSCATCGKPGVAECADHPMSTTSRLREQGTADASSEESTVQLDDGCTITYVNGNAVRAVRMPGCKVHGLSRERGSSCENGTSSPSSSSSRSPVTPSPSSRATFDAIRVKHADQDAAMYSAEVNRLREVIRIGGAMYRLERASMGIPGGLDDLGQPVVARERPPITHVAIRFAGKTWSLPRPFRHHDVIQTICRLDPDVECVDSLGEDQGFLDASGRYLTRPQAEMSAYLNAQIKGTVHGVLTSENLW